MDVKSLNSAFTGLNMLIVYTSKCWLQKRPATGRAAKQNRNANKCKSRKKEQMNTRLSRQNSHMTNLQ